MTTNALEVLRDLEASHKRDASRMRSPTLCQKHVRIVYALSAAIRALEERAKMEEIIEALTKQLDAAEDKLAARGSA